MATPPCSLIACIKWPAIADSPPWPSSEPAMSPNRLMRTGLSAVGGGRRGRLRRRARSVIAGRDRVLLAHVGTVVGVAVVLVAGEVEDLRAARMPHDGVAAARRLRIRLGLVGAGAAGAGGRGGGRRRRSGRRGRLAGRRAGGRARGAAGARH